MDRIVFEANKRIEEEMYLDQQRRFTKKYKNQNNEDEEITCDAAGRGAVPGPVGDRRGGRRQDGRAVDHGGRARGGLLHQRSEGKISGVQHPD